MGAIDLIAIVVVIILITILILTWPKKKPDPDVNVSWHGPDVCLKKKNYPAMKDDFREEISNGKD